jgi:hypothetical protein
MAPPAYFDASAIVKLLVAEPESLALVEYLQEPRAAITSALSLTEVTRCMRRADPARDDIDEALAGFYLVVVDETVLTRAGRIGPPGLRALDTVHLVSALSLAEPDLEFITYDHRLAEAARGHGLRVLQPGVRHDRMTLPP